MLINIINYNESINNIEKSLIIKEGKILIFKEDYTIFNESIINAIKKIGEKIKKLVSDFINWLKNVKTKFFDFFNKVEKEVNNKTPSKKEENDEKSQKLFLQVNRNFIYIFNTFLHYSNEVKNISEKNYKSILNINIKSNDFDEKIKKAKEEFSRPSERIHEYEKMINDKITENNDLINNITKIKITKENLNLNNSLKDLIGRLDVLGKITLSYGVQAEKISSMSGTLIANNEINKDNANYNEFYNLLYKIQMNLANITSVLTSTSVKLITQASKIVLKEKI